MHTIRANSTTVWFHGKKKIVGDLLVLGFQSYQVGTDDPVAVRAAVVQFALAQVRGNRYADVK